MNKQVELIQQWILKRDKRERVVLFLVSLFVIYQLWNVIFIRPVVSAQEILRTQIRDTTSQREAVQLQFDTVIKIVNGSEFLSLSSKQQELIAETKTAKQKIASFNPVFVKESDFSRLTKDIIGQLDKSIILVSLKEFPDQPWAVPDVDKSDISIQNIMQHKLSIEFRANYFDTIAYLVRLEKLPWHLYWDSLEYKVIKYPEADVVVQLYVLSNKMSI